MEVPNPQGSTMSVALNHLILFAQDKTDSARFLAHILGRPEPTLWGPFAMVSLDADSHVEFAEPGFEIQPQHVAFLVSDEDFDGVYERITAMQLPHWADPRMTTPGTFNRNHGGRGVYFRDPSGHGLEVLTQPYGADLR
jgi:catechol 2,3-dioxygenase-like lactoylglutathione lyase family enzyme